MPLHKGQPYTVEHLADLQDNEQVWVVPMTGEACRNYEDYLAVCAEYERKVWQSSLGPSDDFMTYQEAIAEEERVKPQLQQVPEELEETLLHVIHHSNLGLGPLAQRLSDELDVTTVNKENEQGATGLAAAQKHPRLTLPSLRAYVLKVADYNERLGVWIGGADYIKKHQLPALTPELSKKFAKEKREADARVIAPPPPPFTSLKPTPAGKPPKKTKESGASAVASPARSKKGQLGEISNLTPGKAASTSAKAGDTAGGAGSQASPKPKRPRHSGTLRSLEDEAARLTAGTVKHAVFTVLRALSPEELPEGLTVAEVLERAIKAGIKTEWGKNGVKTVRHTMSTDVCFCVVRRQPKIKYSLRAAPGVVAMEEEKPEGEEGGAAGPASGPSTGSKVPKASGGTEKAIKIKIKKKAPDSGGAGQEGAAAEDGSKPAPISVEDCEKQVKETAAKLEKISGMLAPVEKLIAGLRKTLAVKETALQEAEAVLKQLGEAPAAASAEGSEGAPDKDKGPQPQSVTEAAELVEKKKQEVLKLKDQIAVQVRAMEQAQLAIAQNTKAHSLAVKELEKAKLARSKAEAAGSKAEERERQKALLLEEKRKEAERREQEREAERRERELKKLEAKRYPMEDLDLLAQEVERAAEKGAPAPASDVVLPTTSQPACSQLPPELLSLGGDWEVISSVLMVTELVSAFPKVFGLKPFTAADLAAWIHAVAATSSGDTGEAMEGVEGPGAASSLMLIPPGRPEAAASLAALYVALLKAMVVEQEVEDEEGQPLVVWRQDQRWEAVVKQAGAGCWSEVTRRIMLSRAAAAADDPAPVMVGRDYERVSEFDAGMLSAATTLASEDADQLTTAQHAALLRWLCDNALESDIVRDTLAARMDQVAETVQHKRAELAEERAKLKEILDAEREQRKKAAEARLAKKEAAAAAKAAATAAGAAAGADGAAGGTSKDKPDAKPKGKAAKKETGDGSAKKEAGDKDKGIATAGAGGAKDTAQAGSTADAPAAADLPADKGKRGKKDKAGAATSKPEGDAKAAAESSKPRTDSGKTAPAAGSGVEKKAGGAATAGDKSGGAGAGDVDDEDDDEALVLPEELREYKGDPRDRKAVLKFQAAQQTKMRELERARDAKRQEREAERRKREKKKADLEERIANLSEAIERELEKNTVRHAPLGYDRNHRRYWWGVGGAKGVLLVEEGGVPTVQRTTAGPTADTGTPAPEAGQTRPLHPAVTAAATTVTPVQLAAVIQNGTQLEELMKSLDVRGHRELDLHRSLERLQPQLEKEFKRAQAAASKALELQVLAVVQEEVGSRLPARSTRFTGVMDGSGRQLQTLQQQKEHQKEQEAAAAALAAAAAEEANLLASVTCVDGPFEARALACAVAALHRVAAAAQSAKVAAPAGGWRTWQSRLARLLQDDIDPAWARDTEGPEEGSGAGTRSAALSQLVLRLQEVEHLLVSATGEWAVLQKLAADLAAAGTTGTQDNNSDESSESEDEDEGREGKEEGGNSRGSRKHKKRKHKKVGQDKSGAGESSVAADAPISTTPGSELLDDSPEVVLEADEDAVDAVAVRRRPTSVWHSVGERNAWVAAAQAASSAARAAYCALVLEHLALGPLKQLNKAVSAPASKPVAAKTDIKTEAATAGGSRRAPAGLARSDSAHDVNSGPSTRDKATRASDGGAAGAGKTMHGSAAGGRKRQSAEPEGSEEPAHGGKVRRRSAGGRHSSTSAEADTGSDAETDSKPAGRGRAGGGSKELASLPGGATAAAPARTSRGSATHKADNIKPDQVATASKPGGGGKGASKELASLLGSSEPASSRRAAASKPAGGAAPDTGPVSKPPRSGGSRELAGLFEAAEVETGKGRKRERAEGSAPAGTGRNTRTRAH